MKKRLFLLGGTVIATVILCAVLLTVSTSAGATADAVSSSPEELNFTLLAYGGAVALFDDEELLEVYDDIVLNALPPADRTALEEGIAIKSFEQLSALLEDFDG